MSIVSIVNNAINVIMTTKISNLFLWKQPHLEINLYIIILSQLEITKFVPAHLQLLLLVSSNNFEFIVDHGGLGQVEGVCRNRRERGRRPSGPSVQGQGCRAVAGGTQGPEPRRDPGRSAAHAGGGGREPGRVPENLPVGWRGVSLSVAHLCRESVIKLGLKELCKSL